MRRLGGKSRWLVTAVAALNGVGAVLGGLGLLRDAEGMGYKESWLRGPFTSYAVPGAFLLVVIGGGMLATAGLAMRRHRLAPRLAWIMGAILLAWLVIETLVIGYRGPIQIGFLVACGASAVVLLRAGSPRSYRATSAARGVRSW
jgi:hypothetical protein